MLILDTIHQILRRWKKVGNYAKAYADLLTWDGDMNTWQEKRDKLPFRPFVENFDRAFDPIADLVAPKIAEYKAKREEKYNALKESNPVQSTVGNIAGEFAKYGAGYAALGPLASKAPGLAAIKNPTAKFLATEGAKDLAVGTAIRGIEGVADKQSPTEIGKNIIKYIPMDLAFNAGMLGAGKIAKKVIDNADMLTKIKRPINIEDHVKESIKKMQVNKTNNNPRTLRIFSLRPSAVLTSVTLSKSTT